jgi:transcriptional regulator of acetoin/glycerol metabolism
VAAYVVSMTQGPRVRIEDLPQSLLRPRPDLQAAGQTWGGIPVHVRVDLPYMEARRVWLDDFQQRYVEAILEAHDGNVSAAARAAEMDRRSIQRILARNRASDDV